MRDLDSTPGRWVRAGVVIAMATAAVSGCGGGGGGDGGAEASVSLESATGRASSSTVLVQSANTDGRLLASNCFQCHGTMGTGGFEQIRGKSANELIEFFDKPASRDIMAAHAQGYTADQLRKVAAYLQQ